MNKERNEVHSKVVGSNYKNSLQKNSDRKKNAQKDAMRDDDSTHNDDIHRVHKDAFQTTTNFAAFPKTQNECVESVATGITIHADDSPAAQQHSYPMSPPPPPRKIGIQEYANDRHSTMVFPTNRLFSEKSNDLADDHREARWKTTTIDDDTQDINEIVTLVKSSLTKKQCESIAQGIVSHEEEWSLPPSQQPSPLVLPSSSVFSLPKSLLSEEDNAISRKGPRAGDGERYSNSLYGSIDWDTLKKRNISRQNFGLCPMSPQDFLQLQSPLLSPSPPLATGHKKDHNKNIILRKRVDVPSSRADDDEHWDYSQYPGLDWDAFKRRNKLRKKFKLSPMSPEEFLEVASPTVSPSPLLEMGERKDNGVLRTSVQSATNLPSSGRSDEQPIDAHCESQKKKITFDESFPMILHRFLNDLNNVKHGTDIASYDTSGSAFNILDDEAFEEVMTMYFPQMNSFSTFRLQLKVYGFKESPSPLLNSVAYSHPQFHRDRPLLVAQMTPANRNIYHRFP